MHDIRAIRENPDLYKERWDARGLSGEALVSAKERLRNVPGRGIGYGLLRYLGNPEAAGLLAAAPEAPAAEISFNYLGRFDQVLTESSPFAGAEAWPFCCCELSCASARIISETSKTD